MNDILLIPESDCRRGIGHFKRLVFYLTAASLRADILIPDKAEQERLSAYCSREVRRAFITTVPSDRHYRLVLVDTFTISARAVERYRRSGAVVCALDARGSGADYCDYVIDILPRIHGRAGNIAASQLLPIPYSATLSQHREKAVPAARSSSRGIATHGGAGQLSIATPSATTAPRRVLMYFGSRSRARLISKAIRILRRHYPSDPLEIFIPIPASDPLPSTSPSTRCHIHYFHAPQSLDEKLVNVDTVVTSFGLTALAALLHNKELLMLNLTHYHARCARTLHTSGRAGRHCYRPQFFSAAFFKALLATISDTHPSCCPLCSSTRYRVYARFPMRSFARCMRCQMRFMLLHSAQSLSYDKHYFDTEYRKQYGKSYLEDFDHIYQMSKERMTIINTMRYRRKSPALRHSTHSSPTLFDIGCAYGPFLRAAQDYGFSCYGIDVNGEAINYVKEQITNQVAQCGIGQCDPQALFGRRHFDVITMWYVIEHLSSLKPILCNVSALLPLGGIFAFSTPNRVALPFRADRFAALHSSPADHYTLWGVKEARNILPRFGLRVARVVPHGFHTQHYPNLPPRVGRFLSRQLHYGTTFSVYAEKIS